ncbi:MAG: hypothetical protein EP344_13315 [Bacteroidetes bacterium]|nr:MAG: hypothetical protein EP344_13315 [Bacteroidota bacterium]
MRLIILLPLFLLPLSSRAQKRIHTCAESKAPLLLCSANGSTDQRSDSIDILETRLLLDISDFSAKTIHGQAEIVFASLVDGNAHIRLDLLNMTIDSVVSSLQPAWTYDGASLDVSWSTPLSLGGQAAVTVFYHGKPVQDASGWGGFYWVGAYAYNLGVGFAADPHNFGRAWFPCFDNFTERCSFYFEIITTADKVAYCNGKPAGMEPLPGNKARYTWQIDDPIPSYLACVAVGPYTSYKRVLPGEAGQVPVEIAVAPADSNKLKASFIHLPEAVAAFEHWFGPFRWDKVGYAIIPFNQGAMEHATNIAYMSPAVDGTTGSETLMAHELSHHWWGDLATCSTAEDMWLNEGWAVYSEHLFLEQVYGSGRFHDEVQSNFLDVLEDTHVKEGGYRAVSGLPHSLTYGEHVYHKGAVVAHNLRGYLGDSLFRTGLRTVLANHAFTDWSSAGFRDALHNATGYNLNPFFENWVFSPGFTHFSIDSLQIQLSPVDGPTRVRLFVRQKLRGATGMYTDVPLEFTLTGPTGDRIYRSTTVSGETSIVDLFVPYWFFPVRVWVNTRQRLTLARAEKEILVTETKNYNFAPAKLTLNVTALPADSALIRVEHHYVMPDTAGIANPQQFRLSNRYWTVDALQPFEGEASIIYDGKGQLDQLDAELFALTGPKEDSIVLLYRPGPGHPWLEHPNYTKNTVGSAQDRFGILRALQVLPGQYAIGKGTSTVSANGPRRKRMSAAVSPNPATEQVRIRADHPFLRGAVIDRNGTLIHTFTQSPAPECSIRTTDWPAGTYWILLSGEKASGIAGPLVLVR